LLVTLGFLLITPMISVALLQHQRVQQLLKEKASEWVSRKTGMQLTIGRVTVAFPGLFMLQNVVIYDHHGTLMLKSDRLSVVGTSVKYSKQNFRIDKLFLRTPYLFHKHYPEEPSDNLSLFFERLSAPEKPDRDEEKPIPTYRVGRIVVTNGTYISELKPQKSTKTPVDFNFLHLTELRADCSNLFVRGEVINIRIDELSLFERSGFRLIDLSTYCDISPKSIRLQNLEVETPFSGLALDLGLHYTSFADFASFEQKVFIRSEIRMSTLNTHDVGYFVNEFSNTNNRINLKGSLQGFVRNFSTRNFQFSLGGTSFDGDMAMKGLPDINTTRIILDINHMVIDPKDVAGFSFNSSGMKKGIQMPEMLLQMGPTDVRGSFDGTWRDFYTNADFSGRFGALSADLKMSTKAEVITVNGSVSVRDVNVGDLLGYDQIGLVSMDADIRGSGSSTSWAFDVGSTIQSVDFMNYVYRNIEVSGAVKDRMFQGGVDVEDENIALNFNGLIDFNGTIPTYNFVADIHKANLANLGFVHDTVRGLLKAHLTMDMQGDHLDNMAGLVSVDKAEFKTPARNFLLNHFELSAFSSRENRRKYLTIQSDYLDGDIHGNFSFAELEVAFLSFARIYAGALIGKVYPVVDSAVTSDVNDLMFGFVLKNTGNLTELLTGTRIETGELQMNGAFNAGNASFRFDARTEEVLLNGMKFSHWRMDVRTEAIGLVARTSASEVQISPALTVYNPSWWGSVDNDLLLNTFQWNNSHGADSAEGSMTSRLNLKTYPNVFLTFLDGKVLVKDTLWSLRSGSSLSWASNNLVVNNVMLSSHGQSITIDGSASQNNEGTILCSFRELDLSWIDFLTKPHKVDLDGMVNGTVSIRNLWETPRILADLSLRDFAYNGDPMGAVKLISLWDDEAKGMKINADFFYQGNVGVKKTAEIIGYIYPLAGRSENFDLSADFDNFRINFLSNFLTGITSDVRGFASGKLYLRGPFDTPELTGKLKVNARTLFFDYLNTRYSFADSVIFTRSGILFNQIQLSDNNRLNTRDPYSATLNGAILHRGFRDFVLDLNIKAENFTFLNTNGTQDPMYFGRAVATGNISITGPDNDILIKVQARTDRNTQLEIPLVSSSQISRSSFINFIQPGTDDDDDEMTLGMQARRVQKSNLRLDFNLQVTPEATIRLIFDPLIGDVIEGSGSGNLLMSIDSEGEFDLRGQYTISKGDYIFNLENIISKKFSVKSGGTIRWTGDPYDALMDIEAVYPLRASLAPLNPEDSARALQSVECVIHMTERLIAPAVDFRIEFPEMTSFDNERYQAMIKPNLNYQFLSLLAINRFVNSQSQQFVETGNTANIAGTNTTEMLANQVSVWISNISDEFDVDFAYHPRSGLSPEQLEALIRTQVLNDRLTIESKVGIGGRTYAGEGERTSNMVGDISAEYRIDREGRFKVKAFNRHNDENMLYEGAPYTQGVGVFYRKEFNSLRDLFRKPKQPEVPEP
jgi:hypothetical protein